MNITNNEKLKQADEHIEYIVSIVFAFDILSLISSLSVAI